MGRHLLEVDPGTLGPSEPADRSLAKQSLWCSSVSCVVCLALCVAALWLEQSSFPPLFFSTPESPVGWVCDQHQFLAHSVSVGNVYPLQK